MAMERSQQINLDDNNDEITTSIAMATITDNQIIYDEEHKQTNDDSNNNEEKSQANKEEEEIKKYRNPSGRVEVGTRVYITRISQIDLVAQTFDADFEIEYQWHATKEEYELYQGDPQNYIPLYVPPHFFTNGNCSKQEIQIMNYNQGYRVVSSGDKGSWYEVYGDDLRYPFLNLCHYKYSGEFTEKFELSNFPFDVQDLQINIECIDNTEKAVFVPCHKTFLADYAGYFSLTSSTLQEYIVHPYFVEYGYMDYADPFSNITIRIKLERKWGIYFWKIAIFAFVSTASAIFVFSMDPVDNLADRYGFLVTLLLTAVAFQFVISTEMPKLPYLTILDQYILLSFGFLFVIMIMIGIVPFFGDRYSHEPGEYDSIAKWDSIFVRCCTLIIILYHIYFCIKIMRSKKFEMAKIDMDQWDAAKVGYEESDGLMKAKFSHNIRVASRYWKEWIDHDMYTIIKKREY